MSDDRIEIAMLKREIDSLKQSAGISRSAALNTFLNLKVMIEEGEHDEALDLLTELTK